MKRGVGMKGQGLPITTIIIAALGIIVLVVMGAIFSGQIGTFGRAASECPGKCYIRSPTAEVQQSGATFVQGETCDALSETRVSGSYIARGTPKSASSVNDFRCTACCVQTG